MKQLCILSILLLSSAISFAQILINDVQTIEGPWEFTSASGIDGVFISFNSFLRSQSGETAINSQGINIRVYHRQNGIEHLGYFAPGEYSGSSVGIDAQHLTMRFDGHTELGPFDIDLGFDPKIPGWKGIWNSQGHSHEVTLERPGFAGPQAKFVGDWNGSASGFASTTLHIRQSSDGQFVVWLDRSLSAFNPRINVQQTDQRNGELLAVLSVDKTHIKLKTASAFGNQYAYDGTVSDDGKMLTGTWKSPEGGSGRLNAPDNYTRTQ